MEEEKLEREVEEERGQCVSVWLWYQSMNISRYQRGWKWRSTRTSKQLKGERRIESEMKRWVTKIENRGEERERNQAMNRLIHPERWDCLSGSQKRQYPAILWSIRQPHRAEECRCFRSHQGCFAASLSLEKMIWARIWTKRSASWRYEGREGERGRRNGDWVLKSDIPGGRWCFRT